MTALVQYAPAVKNRLTMPLITAVFCLIAISSLVFTFGANAAELEPDLSVELYEIDDDGGLVPINYSEFVNGNIIFGTNITDDGTYYSINSVANLVNNRVVIFRNMPGTPDTYSLKAYSSGLGISFTALFENATLVDISSLDVLVKAYMYQTDEFGKIIPDSVDMSTDHSNNLMANHYYLIQIDLVSLDCCGNVIDNGELCGLDCSVREAIADAFRKSDIWLTLSANI